MSFTFTTRFRVSLAGSFLLALAIFFAGVSLVFAKTATVGTLQPEREVVGTLTDQTVIPVTVIEAPNTEPSVRALDSRLEACLAQPPLPEQPDYLKLQWRFDERPALNNAAGREPSACGVSWVVYEWQMRAGAIGGQVQLKELSAGAGGGVTVVAEGPVQTLNPNGVNTLSIGWRAQPLGPIIFAVSVVGTGSAPLTLGGGSKNSWGNNVWYSSGVLNLAGNLAIGSEAGLQVGAIDRLKDPSMVVKLETDFDKDGLRDSIDDDIDGDGLPNDRDNCRWVSNPDQLDKNHNGVGFACGDNVEEWEDWREQLRASDYDRDGLSFQREITSNTDVCDSDSDDDGVPDGKELRVRTNPQRFDSDKDGLGDGLELAVRRVVYDARGPEKTCTDSRPDKPISRLLLATHTKHFRFDRDRKTKTNPRRRDTDHDGVSDGREDRNHNGRRDRGERDPLHKERR